MVTFAYQRELSRPKKHIWPVKQWLQGFVYVLSGLFRYPRWPPSAILDFLSYPKMMFLSTKWPKEDILCILAHNMPREAGPTWFICNQSITGSHLENDKMAKIAYSSDQSCPNEEFWMPKWCKLAFYFSWRSLFRNPRWPPSAILFWSDNKKNVHFAFTGSNANYLQTKNQIGLKWQIIKFGLRFFLGHPV